MALTVLQRLCVTGLSGVQWVRAVVLRRCRCTVSVLVALCVRMTLLCATCWSTRGNCTALFVMFDGLVAKAMPSLCLLVRVWAVLVSVPPNGLVGPLTGPTVHSPC